MKKLLLNPKKGTLLICVMLILPFVMSAQTTNTIQPQSSPARTNIWYFGDHAGLDFSTGTPVPLLNGAMESFECAGAMSDTSGNLLFYSNGGDFPYAGGVWNRNHQLMPNGATAGRGGCNSSEQGALIVPMPRSKNIYYLFTTDCMENNGVGGLRYNVIDMNADGGLGDVVVSAQKLTTPTDESLTAIQHANGIDWWIVAHKLETDSFYAYLFNYQGIAGVVKTKIGYVTPMWAGALKASTDGSKLVYAGLNWTSLFDFDTKTGIISHHVDLNLAGYTAAFSNNCRYLYVANGSGQQIYQYDLTTTDIPLSKTLVGATSSTGFGGLSTGLDNKIYCSRFVSSLYLGVITDPDLPGTACNYVDNGQYLGGKDGKGGLPNFPNTMLGGCVEYPTTDNDDTSSLRLSVNNVGASHATLSWKDSKSNAQYAVMYREAGQPWTKTTVNETIATLPGLKQNTTYDIRVVPLPENEAYEALTDHYLADELASLKTSTSQQSEGIAQITTGQEFDFDLYPNPSHGYTSIDLNVGEQNTELTVKVTDIQGNLVDEQKVNNVSGFTHYQLATDKLADGIYNVQVETASNNSNKKLVIVR